MPPLSRRHFLGVAPLILAPVVLGDDKKPAPSKRITLGIIGTGNQGLNDIRGLPRRRPRPDRRRLRRQRGERRLLERRRRRPRAGQAAGREALRRPHKKSGTYKGCDAYADFRELLAPQGHRRRGRLHARTTGTPSPSSRRARRARTSTARSRSSLTIAEGRAMSDAVKKYKRVFQCGSQQRSDRNFRRACELVRNGRIGKLHTVRCGLPGGRPDFGKTGDRKKPEPVPEGLRLRDVAGAGPEEALRAGALPRQLPLDLRLLRRAGDRLGRPPPRLRHVGHGHRRHRPDGDPATPRASSPKTRCGTPRPSSTSRRSSPTA